MLTPPARRVKHVRLRERWAGVSLVLQLHEEGMTGRDIIDHTRLAPSRVWRYLKAYNSMEKRYVRTD